MLRGRYSKEVNTSRIFKITLPNLRSGRERKKKIIVSSSFNISGDFNMIIYFDVDFISVESKK